MKKVILLAPTPPPAGGIAGWTARMLKAKLKNGWQVEVVDEKSIGNREVFGESGKRHFAEEISRSFQIWKKLKESLRDPEAKVVQSCIPAYTFSMLREYVCALITKQKKRKFIVHFRCTVPNAIVHRYEKFILKRLCNISDMVFSLNRQSKEMLCELTKTPVRIIPNFISEDELVLDRNINDELRTIIYVGGIVENKGIREIINVAEKIPDIQFLLIGKGDSIFEEEAKRREIANVVFSGGKDHETVKKELLKADAFIFLTHFRGEGFSNSLCEAMAAGLPCIVTDWAANRDMIGEEGGIVISSIGDIDTVVSAIQSIRNRDVRVNMSKRNIQKVKADYIESAVIKQYIDSYEELIGKNLIE